MSKVKKNLFVRENDKQFKVCLKSASVDIEAYFASCQEALDFYYDAAYTANPDESFESGDIENLETKEVISYFTWKDDRRVGYNLNLWVN